MLQVNLARHYYSFVTIHSSRFIRHDYSFVTIHSSRFIRHDSFVTIRAQRCANDPLAVSVFSKQSACAMPLEISCAWLGVKPERVAARGLRHAFILVGFILARASILMHTATTVKYQDGVTELLFIV